MPEMTCTRAGLAHGARHAFPIAAGAAIFGLAFGVTAQQIDLGLPIALAMSALVNAGTAQLLAMELWHQPLPLTAIVLATLAVNARLLLMGASLRPWFTRLHPARVYGSLFFMADGNWAFAVQRFETGYRDAGYLLGAGLAMYCAWLGSTAVGYGLGHVVARPQALGLDFLLLGFFTTMLIAGWRGRASVLPWTVAAVVAVIAQAHLPGHTYVLAGGIAGSLAGLIGDAGR